MSPLARSFGVLFAPTAATEDLRPSDAFYAGAVVFAGFVTAAAIAQPAIFRMLAPSMVLSPRALAIVLGVQVIATAIVLAARWGSLSYIAWGFGSACGASAGLSSYFGVVVLAEGVYALQSVFTAILTILSAPSNLGRGHWEPAIGLNLLLRAPSELADTVFNEVNVFAVWHVVLVFYGLKAVARLGTAPAAAIAVSLWVLGVSAEVILKFGVR